MRAVVVIALVGCGRIGFAELGGDADDATGFDGSDDSDGGLLANFELAAGGPNTCVRIGGGVWCWGRGDQGQLGDGSTMHTGVPRSVPLPDGAISLSTADSGSCVRFANNRAACWGINDVGQFGMTGQLSMPTLISPLAIAEVAVGQQVVCVRRTNGTVACAGLAGLLGDGSTMTRAAFGDVPTITDAISIVAGDQHTCVLHPDRSVSCWGHGTAGQLGNGTFADSTVPSATGPAGPYSMLAAGDNHTCGVIQGLVECWGGGASGQLGNGLFADVAVPTQVMGLDKVVEIAAGAQSMCARREDNTIWCWGRNVDGELGNGMTAPSQLTPTQVVISAALDVSAFTSVHACAVRADRQVACWGNNQYGQCGRGTVGGVFPTPNVVSGLPPL